MALPGRPSDHSTQEWARAAFAVYRDNVASRRPPDGTSEEDRLEREGRGWTAFTAKWRAAFRKWEYGDCRGGKKAEGAVPRRILRRIQIPSSTAPPRFTPNPMSAPTPPCWHRRQWLYGHHLIRGYLSLLVAPGGVGTKSASMP